MKKVFVAGHRGLVGSATCKALSKKARNFMILTQTHKELDLEDREATLAFLERERPNFVVLSAAKVGGILANSTYPVDFLHKNLQIQLNVIDAAYKVGVERLIFLGSSCIYPRECPQPIKEEYLLTGPLEPTNRPYALAKIAGIESCWSYNRQFGTQYLALMPTNMYGPNDNYHPQNSHVLPALLRRFHEAKLNKEPSVVVWGTGTPLREFMYSEDFGEAVAFLLDLPESTFKELTAPNVCPLINVGIGTDVTIRQLAETVKNVVGYNGDLIFDSTKPDGTPRKLLNVDKIKGLGWSATTTLEEGLKLTYSNYLENASKI